jgi:hypothetical protein
VNDRDDELERALRGALAREAEQIEARPGDYHGLQQRLADAPGGRRGAAWLPWLATAAAVATIVGLSGAWLTGRPAETANPAATSDAPELSPSVLADELRRRRADLREREEEARRGAQASGATVAASPVSSPTSTPGATPSPTPVGATRGLPVYWIGDAPLGRKGLFREFESTTVVSAQNAVDAMLTTEPMDHDYSSPWRAGDATVTLEPELITVDLARAAFGSTGIDRQRGQLALQQLVYTVTAGAALELGHVVNVPVRILVDGAEGATVWDGISLSAPITRDASARAPLWITDLAEGDSVRAGDVKVNVYGTAYEANALWVVYDAHDDQIVDQSYVMVGGNGTLAAGSFTVKLQPGEYRIRVYSPDESGGDSGFPEDPGDTKVIRVH